MFVVVGAVGSWAPVAHATRIANFQVSGQNIVGQSNGTTKSRLITGSVLHSNCNITVVNNSTQYSQTIVYFIKLSINTPGNGVTVNAPINTWTTVWQSDPTAAGTSVTLSPTSAAADAVTPCTTGADACTFPISPHDDFYQPVSSPNASTTVPSNANFPVSYLNGYPVTNPGTPMPNTLAGFVDQVKCEGWIKVDDATAGNGGFVTASGTLTTFTESMPLVGLKDDSKASLVTTTPSNTPIIIQEGRPF